MTQYLNSDQFYNGNANIEDISQLYGVMDVQAGPRY